MSYTLSVIKKNQSNNNTSNNVQEGFSLDPNENKIYLLLKLTLVKKMKCCSVIFYDEKKTIGKDRVVLVMKKKSRNTN
jgi:hypothetical protein